jgi:hypothetical protein
MHTEARARVAGIRKIVPTKNPGALAGGLTRSDVLFLLDLAEEAIKRAAAEPEAKAVSGSEPGGFLPCKCGTGVHCAVHFDEHGGPR